MRRMRWVMGVIIAGMVVGLPGLLVAQRPTIVVSTPVHGRLIWLDRVGNMFLGDTYSGETWMPVSHDVELNDAVWDPQGARIAYFYGRGGASHIYNTRTQTTQVIVSFPGREDLFFPQSWTADGQNILYIAGVPSFTGNSVYSLDFLNVDTQSLTTLLRYEQGQSLTDIPLPSGVTEAMFIGIDQALVNPVHNEWLALQFHAEDPNDVIEELGTRKLTVNVLWNTQTSAQSI